MSRPENYKTKQREAILNYIISLSGRHVTAAQLATHFQQTEAPIGRTTIYRHLDKMTENGTLRRYTTDGISGACYQYVEPTPECRAHLHLKCESCNELIHLDCDELSDFGDHVLQKHAFRVNALKTVLYGFCEECMKNNSKI